MATDLGFLLALIVFPQGTLNTLSSPLREMLHLQHAEAAELLDVYKGAWKLSWCHIVLKACFMSNHYFQTFFFCHFQITLKKKKQFPARGMRGCHSNSGGSLSQRDGRWHEHCTDVSLGSLAQQVKALVPREPQHI